MSMDMEKDSKNTSADSSALDLNALRGQINEIDSEILKLFERRMDVCCRVAEYKIENGLQIFHPDREQQIVERVRASVDENMKNSVETLFTNIMDISKCKQFQRFFADATPYDTRLLDLSGRRIVAVPGAVASYSHAAAMKLMPECEPVFYETFGEVFAAVESGSAEFGVIPISNSTAGTVTQTYELLSMYDLKICASTKIEISHVLCARPDTDPAQIRRVYSHEQALMQCSKFLAERGYSTGTFDNTALAAIFVKESDKPYGAICSEVSAKHRGLKIIESGIANADNNFTRFILISKDMRLDDDADIISVALRLPHQQSALYRLLTKFSVAGLNLTKLESRPIANTDFDVLFYLDFEGSVRSPDVVKLLHELETELKYMKFLGNYKEIK